MKVPLKAAFDAANGVRNLREIAFCSRGESCLLISRTRGGSVQRNGESEIRGRLGESRRWLANVTRRKQRERKEESFRKNFGNFL